MGATKKGVTVVLPHACQNETSYARTCPILNRARQTYPKMDRRPESAASVIELK